MCLFYLWLSLKPLSSLQIWERNIREPEITDRMASQYLASIWPILHDTKSIQFRHSQIIAVEIYHFVKTFTISKLSLRSIQWKSFQISNPEITLGRDTPMYFWDHTILTWSNTMEPKNGHDSFLIFLKINKIILWPNNCSCRNPI